MAQIYEYQDIDAHVILLFVHPAGYADFLSAMPPVPMTGPYHVRVNHQHGFTCAKKNNKKRKRQDPVKVPLSHSHERVVRLPIV